MIRRRIAAAIVTLLVVGGNAAAQSVAYRLSFPEPQHRWMEVEIAFANLGSEPLELHMSRSSPGRYSPHDFAKNVFSLAAADDNGRSLPTTQLAPSRWLIPDHPAALRVRYRVFGDRVDGTYLAIDTTHAHVNMPAALMWARGLEERPITVAFVPPALRAWRVATQLFPTADPLTFSAPNLQYLMDSPAEFGALTTRTFTVTDGTRAPTFNVVVHHTGNDGDVEAATRSVQALVTQARGVFGEFAPFDGNSYTFLVDYLPWANSDGMEHRNSTVITGTASVRSDTFLDSAAHEFLHSWNVERLRPRSLEPFNFDDVNMSGELWLAEGFNNYYGPLILQRAGLRGLAAFADEIGGMIDETINSPGRRLRTAEEMSRLAPAVDRSFSDTRTNLDSTYLSYYTWGAAIAAGLDLTLRERTDGRVTLDDYMRELWRRYGKPASHAPGYVDRPYTADDLKDALAAVTQDRAFANDFFARYVQGHEVPEFARLFALAGLALRPIQPSQGFVGDVRFQDSATGVRVISPTVTGTPAYDAGLDRDDVIVSVNGQAVRSAAALDATLRAARPGTTLAVVFLRRGERVVAQLAVVADPRLQLVPIESTGQALSAAQRRFRESWLGANP